MPVGSRDRQQLIVVTRDGNTWTETSDGAVVFVPLLGEQGFPTESDHGRSADG